MSDARTRLEEALDGQQAGEPLQVQGDGWQAEVRTAEVGPVGVVVDKLTVRGARGDLPERAQALVDRVRPSGERLRTIELAPALGGAVLRSEPEDMRGGRYYELELGEEQVELTRHRARPEGGRQRESYALTRDELGRLVDDLGEIMRPDQDED